LDETQVSLGQDTPSTGNTRISILLRLSLQEDFGVLRLDAAFMGAGLLAPTITASKLAGPKKATIFSWMKKRPKQNQDAPENKCGEGFPVDAGGEG